MMKLPLPRPRSWTEWVVLALVVKCFGLDGAAALAQAIGF